MVSRRRGRATSTCAAWRGAFVSVHGLLGHVPPRLVGEELEVNKQRHKAFYFMARLLRETVECFGEVLRDSDEDHRFYSELNFSAVVPEFLIRLCGLNLATGRCRYLLCQRAGHCARTHEAGVWPGKPERDWPVARYGDVVGMCIRCSILLLRRALILSSVKNYRALCKHITFLASHGFIATSFINVCFVISRARYSFGVHDFDDVVHKGVLNAD